MGFRAWLSATHPLETHAAFGATSGFGLFDLWMHWAGVRPHCVFRPRDGGADGLGCRHDRVSKQKWGHLPRPQILRFRRFRKTFVTESVTSCVPDGHSAYVQVGLSPCDAGVYRVARFVRRDEVGLKREHMGAEAQEPEAKPRVIAKRLAVGFGLVSLVAVAMCAMLISLIAEVAGLVTSMRKDEAAIRESLTLATSVREQYMHQAHWIIERDDTHIEHYKEWVERVRNGVRVLRPLVPEGEAWRLDHVEENSRALDTLFFESIIPAVKGEDRAQLARHHKKAEGLSQQATKHADVIAKAVERRMASAHVSATKATQLGLLSGGMCVFLVLALSGAFTVRLRRAVLKPLEVLANAARRFGSGNFRSRVGSVGEGELLAVAQAFDRMAEELETREERLIESERMAAIGQLAAGVAHEINNPIQVIRGYLKTMGPDSPPDTLKEELQILDEEATACQRIAEDLVAYARTPDLQYAPLEMDQLLKESVRRFQETSEGSAQRIECSVEPGTVFADGGRLRQVLLNLLLNAAQVSDSESPIHITGTTSKDGGYEIAVSDRGPGISDEDRSKIFEPFFSKRTGGSGLGLAVCQGIIHAHGGTISVEARSKGGSTFRLRIPASTRQEARPSS